MIDHFKNMLALLRAAHQSFWTSHWQIWGDSFYGDHLMFQRFYEAMPEEVDSLAEKMVSMFGPDSVDLYDQSVRMLSWISAWDKIDCPIKRSLAIEKNIQDALVLLKKEAENQGQMTLGLDDLLPAIANSHETNGYLLRQRMYKKAYEHKKANMSNLEKGWSGNSTFAPVAGSTNFNQYFRNPHNKELREFYQSGAKSNLPQHRKDDSCNKIDDSF